MEFGSEAVPGGAGAAFSVTSYASLFLGILTPVVGRIFLACLPPGLPGRHAPRDLLVTWAASVVLGLTWLILTGPIPWPHSTERWIFLGVPFVLLAGLLALRPAGLVPRHAPVPESRSVIGRVLVAAAFAVLVIHVVIADGWTSIVDAWFAAACVALVLHALDLARVRSDVRGAAALLTALIALPFDRAIVDGEVLSVLVGATVAAGCIGWLRRGDRRELGLASAGIALAPHLGSTGLVVGLACAIAIVVGSAARARARAATWTIGALAIGIATSLLRDQPLVRTATAHAPHAWSDHVIAMILLAVLATAWALHRRSAPTSPNPSGAPAGREWKVMLAATTLAIAVWIVGTFLDGAGIGRFFALQPRPHGAVFTLIAVAGAIALSRGLERRPSAP